MENNNYPQAKLDLSEILEYANSDVNYLDKQRILKQQLPLLQSYAKERDLHSVIKLLKSFLSIYRMNSGENLMKT